MIVNYRSVIRSSVVETSHQFGLDGSVVLLVDDVVHAVAVDQQILLEKWEKIKLIFYIRIASFLSNFGDELKRRSFIDIITNFP